MCSGERCSRRAHVRVAERDVAHVPSDVLVLVARQGCAGEGRRAVDGPRQRRHDAERPHAGARRLGARQRSRRPAADCSRLFTDREAIGSDAVAKSLKRMAGRMGRFSQLPADVACGLPDEVRADPRRRRRHNELGIQQRAPSLWVRQFGAPARSPRRRRTA